MEVCDDLSTDAFPNGLRCFVSLRGAARTIYCDQGTNPVGGRNELELESIKNESLRNFLEQAKCEFVFNSPSASHMGGVWERQIQTFRGVLSGLTLSMRSLYSSSIRTLIGLMLMALRHSDQTILFL